MNDELILILNDFYHDTKCDFCGKMSPVDFKVSDEVWLTVIPSEHRNAAPCLDCFFRYLKDYILKNSKKGTRDKLENISVKIVFSTKEFFIN